MTRYKDKSKSQLIDEIEKLQLQVSELIGNSENNSKEDLSKKNPAEVRKKISEKRSLALLENSPVCTKVIDLDFNLQFMSTAGVKALLIDDITEFYGKPYPLDFYPDSFKLPMLKKLHKAKETGEIFTFDASIFDLEGNELWFHSIIVPIKKSDGQLDYLMVLSLDTTETRKIERELRESESRFRDLSDALQEGIGITVDGVIMGANSQLANMFGYTLDDFVGLSVLNLVAPESQTLVKEKMTDFSEEAYEHVGIRKDQSKILVKSHSVETIFKGNQGKVTAIRDFTEIRRLQELEERAARLETAGTIAGQVAHDFNNLLTPLMAYPEFIRDELPKDHPALSYLEKIEQASIQIANINQDLLAMGRRGHYNLEVLNLNSVIENVLENIEPNLDSIHCDIQFCPDIMAIRGGGAQLLRMISNILHNAVDSIEGEGKISVKTENFYFDNNLTCYGSIPRGEYVKLTISDTGCGISDDIVHKIFDPFFTSKKADKKRGSGLGMSVVDAVIKDHNGYIDLVTNVGEGTSFYIYLPITRESKELIEPSEIIGGTESILIVDDDDIQREVSSHILKKLGYKIHCVTSGEAANLFLQENPQDLVILDMVMPGGIDGTETYKKIIEKYPNQKAIIVSGFSESKRVLEAQKLGVGEFVKKPFTKSSISSAVRKELDRKITLETYV